MERTATEAHCLCRHERGLWSSRLRPSSCKGTLMCLQPCFYKGWKPDITFVALHFGSEQSVVDVCHGLRLQGSASVCGESKMSKPRNDSLASPTLICLVRSCIRVQKPHCFPKITNLCERMPGFHQYGQLCALHVT